MARHQGHPAIPCVTLPLPLPGANFEIFSREWFASIYINVCEKHSRLGWLGMAGDSLTKENPIQTAAKALHSFDPHKIMVQFAFKGRLTEAFVLESESII